MNSHSKSWAYIAVAAMSMILGAQNSNAGCGTCGPDEHGKKETKPACCVAAEKAGTKCTVCAPKDRHISTRQMMEHVAAGEALILDARFGEYDDGTRIPGGQSLNINSNAEEVAKVIPKTDSLVITYCNNPKCPASKMLAEHLNNLGYTNVLVYPDGIDGWKAAGGEVLHTK